MISSVRRLPKSDCLNFLERVEALPPLVQPIFSQLCSAGKRLREFLHSGASKGTGRITMKSLFVGNMSFQTTEGDLRTLFEPFGQITRVHMAMDRETGRARGFAFIEMPNDEEAAKAMAGLDGKELGGRNLKVNEAVPKAKADRHAAGREALIVVRARVVAEHRPWTKRWQRRWTRQRRRRRTRPLLERGLSRIRPAAARTALVACTLHELMDTRLGPVCTL